MKGLLIDPSAGRISIVNGSRTVATTEGTLVNLLTSVYSTTIAPAFPDFQKGIFYNDWWISDCIAVGSPATYAKDEGCVSAVIAKPEEWSSETVITAAPAGADFFVGHMRLNRTTAPSHTWYGATIAVRPKTNVWLPVNGAVSVLVEAEIGMARALSIYISGGNLCLHRQQSVSTAPGGYGTYGDSAPDVNVDRKGGRNRVQSGGVQGLVPYVIQTRSVTAYTETTSSFPDFPVDCRPGGSVGCSLTDPTNYASTYSLELVGRFGRRS